MKSYMNFLACSFLVFATALLLSFAVFNSDQATSRSDPKLIACLAAAYIVSNLIFDFRTVLLAFVLSVPLAYITSLAMLLTFLFTVYTTIGIESGALASLSFYGPRALLLLSALAFMYWRIRQRNA